MTTYVVEKLIADTYYFAITASNRVGIECDYSNEAAYKLSFVEAHIIRQILPGIPLVRT